MNPQTDRAAAIVEQYGCKTENLIAILQDIQAAYNYLSEANLTLVADRLGISVSKVYSVATFYENFSLEAKGRHIIKGLAPEPPATSASPAPFTTPFTSIWACPASAGPATTACSPWRRWPVSAPAAWPR